MTADDASPVAAMIQESPEAAQWTARYLEGLAGGNSAGVTAWVEESPAGVMGFIALRHVAQEAEILNLAVARSSRRQGCGKRLVQHALSEAYTAGVERVFLEVRASNRAAIQLYGQCGFELAGRRPGYYREPAEDALLLARRL